MNDLPADYRSVDASAMLYGLLSLAFAYPGDDLSEALSSGDLFTAVEHCSDELDNAAIRAAASDFLGATAVFRQALDGEHLQSDYIALFELNPAQPPLHLYAHLYAQGKPDPVPVYQRLMASYRDFGIELRDDESVERPDHLSVQLEFMAWLYQLLGQSLRGASSAPASTDIEAAIVAFRAELAWVGNWLSALQQRGGHPFYLPLGRLLQAMLEPNQKTVNLSVDSL